MLQYFGESEHVKAKDRRSMCSPDVYLHIYRFIQYVHNMNWFSFWCQPVNRKAKRTTLYTAGATSNQPTNERTKATKPTSQPTNRIHLTGSKIFTIFSSFSFNFYLIWCLTLRCRWYKYNLPWPIRKSICTHANYYFISIFHLILFHILFFSLFNMFILLLLFLLLLRLAYE